MDRPQNEAQGKEAKPVVGRSKVMRLRFVTTAALSAVALAVAAPVASAQSTSPDQEGYSVPGAAVQTQVESGNDNGPTPVADEVSNPQPAAAVQTADDSTLPFTG